jgi:hypothetical protein
LEGVLAAGLGGGEQGVREGAEGRERTDGEEQVRAEQREAGEEPGARTDGGADQCVGAAGVVVLTFSPP